MLFASLAIACVAAVLAAFDLNVVRTSHGLGVSGADAGGCFQGRRLVSSNGGIVSGAKAGCCCWGRRLVSYAGGDVCGVLSWWKVEPKLGWNLNSNGSGWHLLGDFFLYATRPWPNESIALLCCFAAFLYEGEHICSLVCRDLVFPDVACDMRVAVVAVALNVLPCTHFDLTFPGWAIVRKLFAKKFLPCFALCFHKVFILCWVLYLGSLLGFVSGLALNASFCFHCFLLLCSPRLLAWVQLRGHLLNLWHT